MHLVYLFFVTSLIQPMYAVYILVDVRAFDGLLTSYSNTLIYKHNVRCSFCCARNNIFDYLFQGLHEIVENYSTIRTDSIFVAGTALILAHFSLLAALTVIASNFRKGLRSAGTGHAWDGKLLNMPF